MEQGRISKRMRIEDEDGLLTDLNHPAIKKPTCFEDSYTSKTLRQLALEYSQRESQLRRKIYLLEKFRCLSSSDDLEKMKNTEYCSRLLDRIKYYRQEVDRLISEKSEKDIEIAALKQLVNLSEPTFLYEQELRHQYAKRVDEVNELRTDISLKSDEIKRKDILIAQLKSQLLQTGGEKDHRGDFCCNCNVLLKRCISLYNRIASFIEPQNFSDNAVNQLVSTDLQFDTEFGDHVASILESAESTIMNAIINNLIPSFSRDKILSSFSQELSKLKNDTSSLLQDISSRIFPKIHPINTKEQKLTPEILMNRLQEMATEIFNFESRISEFQRENSQLVSKVSEVENDRGKEMVLLQMKNQEKELHTANELYKILESYNYKSSSCQSNADLKTFKSDLETFLAQSNTLEESMSENTELQHHQEAESERDSSEIGTNECNERASMDKLDNVAPASSRPESTLPPPQRLKPSFNKIVWETTKANSCAPFVPQRGRGRGYRGGYRGSRGGGRGGNQFVYNN